jgi:hypothetical protein
VIEITMQYLSHRMRRLVASGLLPDRAGQPVQVWAHVILAELRDLDDGSVVQQEWIGEMAVRWAARSPDGTKTLHSHSPPPASAA